MDENIFKSFRITSSEKYIPIIDEVLEKEDFSIKKLEFYHRARISLNKKSPGTSILNFFGHIYIQDLSSMLPPLFLNPKKGSVVLDMCASPGGKSAILSELVGDKGIVVANEPNKKRYMTLKKNMERLNLLNVCTSSYKGEEFPENIKFSHILLDVPCSGWGTVKKNPKVVNMWQGKKIMPLIQLQKKLIQKAYNLLTPGGILIYSTCTTNRAENEDQILWATENFDFDIVPLKKIDTFIYEKEKIPGVIAIKGHNMYSQGFFIACLKKTPHTECMEDIEYGDKSNVESIKEFLRLQGVNTYNFPEGIFYQKKDMVFFKKNLPSTEIKTEGVFIGRIKKDKFIPNPRLWSLIEYEPKNRLVVEDIGDIKRLIQGESFSITSRDSFIPFFYKELPLCLLWIKNNRCLIRR